MIRRTLILISILTATEAGLAAIFVVPSDYEFVKQAPAIVIGSALSSHTQLNEHRGIETVTTFSIEETLKGSVDSDTIKIYEIGGVYGNRAAMFPGVPRFTDGERALLFLMKDDSGRWHVFNIALGKFRFATDTLGHEVLIRDIRDSLAFDKDGSSHRELNRAAEPFLDFIRATVKGGPARQDYAIPAEPLLGVWPTPKASNRKIVPLTTYTAVSYDNDFGSGDGSKWCGSINLGNPNPQTCTNAFPSAVHFKSVSSEPGADASGGNPAGSAAIVAAINAWDTATGAAINYAYDGNDASGTTNSPCGSGDSKNTIAFEQDLSCQGIVPFTCTSNSYHGTLGLGGVSAATTPFSTMADGSQFYTTQEGDVWMNLGIANCTLLLQTNKGDWNSAVTHEVGHTLGWRHSDQTRSGGTPCIDPPLECSGSAIMTATVTSGLNATLQTWDVHAASLVYPPGSAPSAVASVEAHATTSTNVQVSWVGSCSTTCHIYRSADHLTYTQVGSSATSPFNDTGVGLTGHAFLYKVRAFNGTTESSDSNTDLATVIIYTNTITAGVSVIQAVDINELRNAVDAVRTLDGIGPGAYTYGTGSPSRIAVGTLVHAADINELRTNLNTAYNGLFGTTPTYTNTIVAGSSTVQAIDFNEIRNIMR